MTTLLFPGRHLLHTNFQRSYLQQVLGVPLDQLEWHKRVPPNLPPINNIVFAITSSNQANSRYNSIPFFVRAIGVDRFARDLQQSLPFDYRILGIPHYQPTPSFAENLLKEIAAQTEGETTLTPDDCVVLCSTPSVIGLFRKLGFSVLSAELDQQAVWTPIEVLKHFVIVGEPWQSDSELRKHLSATTHDLWQDFPDVPRRVLRLWRDPLLNDKGSLTETRDYSTYAYAMANPTVMQLKYNDIKPAIRPGRIVDEGCADAALLSCTAKDFPDSDLVGIELTGEFLARCHERQRAGDFGGSFVHFYQRNIMEAIFADDTIDTTVCNSTIHELWSYGEQQATVDAYLSKKFAQTAPGGRLVVRDVVGPENKEVEVHLWLNDQDGSNEQPLKSCDTSAALREHLNDLSTYGRFIRFAHDYLRELRSTGKRTASTQIEFTECERDGRRFVVVSLRHAAEFLGKMTYTHNWNSEMYEEFTFWDYGEWCAAFERAGFRVNSNLSSAYANPWIVENRYQGKVELYHLAGDGLVPLSYPNTNTVLVGEKPV